MRRSYNPRVFSDMPALSQHLHSLLSSALVSYATVVVSITIASSWMAISFTIGAGKIWSNTMNSGLIFPFC